MRRLYYLFCLLVFSIFVPKVYAFTYNIETIVSSLDVEIGTETEIKVRLENIQGTDNGIKSCSLNLGFDNNVLLSSRVKTFDNWEFITGKNYTFKAVERVLDNTDLFVIPVKINGDASVSLTNINCSDGNDISELDDISIDFTTFSSGNTLEENNCDLLNIKLSEGNINFNSKITEYYITVSSFDDLVVEPILVNDKATYSIEKTEDKEIIIRVVASSGISKEYKILVNEVDDLEVNDKEEELTNNSNNDYTFIFVGIIFILILINVLRIVKNRKRDMTS